MVEMVWIFLFLSDSWSPAFPVSREISCDNPLLRIENPKSGAILIDRISIPKTYSGDKQ